MTTAATLTAAQLQALDDVDLEAHRRAVDELRTLVWRDRYDEAFAVFAERLEATTRRSVVVGVDRVRLLELLVPGGPGSEPPLSDPAARMQVTGWLAHAVNLYGGHLTESVRHYEVHLALAEQLGDQAWLSRSLGTCAKTLRQMGRFEESEAMAERGLELQAARGDVMSEAANRYWVGMGLAHRGEVVRSEAELARSFAMLRSLGDVQGQGVAEVFLAQRALWLGDHAATLPRADAAWDLGVQTAHEGGDLYGALKVIASAARTQGDALLALGEPDAARARLELAISLSRPSDFTEEEIPGLLGLARLSLGEGDLPRARLHLTKATYLAERAPYALYAADCANVASDLALRQGLREKAVELALRARTLAWCQGPPWTYARGVADAEARLTTLGASR